LIAQLTFTRARSADEAALRLVPPIPTAAASSREMKSASSRAACHALGIVEGLGFPDLVSQLLEPALVRGPRLWVEHLAGVVSADLNCVAFDRHRASGNSRSRLRRGALGSGHEVDHVQLRLGAA
jgi:hypothetical protein